MVTEGIGKQNGEGLMNKDTQGGLRMSCLCGSCVRRLKENRKNLNCCEGKDKRDR